MKITLATFLLYMIVCLSSCNSETSKATILEQEYMIYSAILETVEQESIVIFHKTKPAYFSLKNTFENLDKSIYKDFEEKTRKPLNIEKRFSLNRAHKISNQDFSDQDPVSIYKKWDEFNSRFPKARGFYEFSRAGFRKDEKQAVVFVTHHCPSLCGSGTYYLFSKKRSMWKLEQSKRVWVS